MQSSREAKGYALIEEANKALKRWTLFSSESKYEDAAENYCKAAGQFKLAKKRQQSSRVLHARGRV